MVFKISVKKMPEN